MDFLVDLYINFPWDILNIYVEIAGFRISLLNVIVFGFMFGLLIWSIRNIFDF